MTRSEVARIAGAPGRLVRLLFALLLIGVVTWAPPAVAAGERAATSELVLSTGEVRVLRMSAPIRLVASGSDEVCRAAVAADGRRVLLTAIRPGSTDLTIELASGESLSYRVVVTADVDRLEQELKARFAGIEGLNISRQGPFLVLGGEFFRVRDYELVRSATAGLVQVDLACRMSPAALAMIADDLTRRLDHPGIQVEVQGQKVLLTGRVYHEAERTRAMAIARELAGVLVEDALAVVSDRPPLGRGKQVHVVVTVAEVERSAFRRTGIDWPGTIALGGAGQAGVRFSGGNVDPVTGQLTATLGNFLPALHLGSEEGQARSLSRLSLNCRSGESARSRVGGEEPVAVAQSQGVNTVQYVEHGLFVTVQPLVDTDGSIDMRVAVELKLVSGESDRGPSFLVHNVETGATLRPGESFVLAGFLGEQTRRALRGVPGLKRIPLLGALFSSRRFQHNETDLVIFLTPEVRERGSGNTSDESDAKARVLGALGRSER